MIVSRQNRWIKDIRRLRRSKGDRALLEGPHLVGEALAAGIEIEAILATPEFAAEPGGATLLAGWNGTPELARSDLLESAADSDSPRGVVALARLPRGGVETLPRVARGIYVWADSLQEPGNLGALARVAEAAGAAGLALAPGSAHPNHPRALRASAGSLLRLPVARDAVLADLEQAIESVHPSWLALVPRDGEDLYSAALADTALVLLLGAEGPGLGEAALRRAERRLSLPMQPPVESLNATVAAALALYEIARRRSARSTTGC
jgi:TrmH family RNA methyltransferase